MKNFQSLLFLAVISLLSSGISFGQDMNKSLRIGVGANGLLSVKDWNPFQAGLGHEVQLWLERPISTRSSINFTMAYRQLGGYQMKSIDIKEQYFPDEFQSQMKTREVASLDYLDASANWHFKLKENSPWSIGMGLRWSYLVKWNAHEQEILWLEYGSGRITENSFGGGSGSFQRINESTVLEADNFNRQDYGFLIHFAYEISPGLQLKTSYYQGFQKVFKDQLFSAESTYRVTTFSLGLSARLF